MGWGYPQCIFPGIEFAGSAGASAASARVNGGVGGRQRLGGGGSGLVAGQWKNPGTKRLVTGTPKGVLNLMVKGCPLTHPE